MSTENKPFTVWSNPWLNGLVGFAAVMIVVGILLINANEGNPYMGGQTDSEAAGTAFGVGLLQLGGMMAAGWLVACAVCWQIAHSTSRDPS